MLYRALDIFFFVFHIALILFNLFGWIPKRLRKWNLLTLSLTAFSWFGLGLFYGFGYCFLTDWHWSIREELGTPAYSNSYIHFLIREITGIDMNEKIVDVITGSAFFLALTMSILMNIRSRRSKD